MCLSISPLVLSSKSFPIFYIYQSSYRLRYYELLPMNNIKQKREREREREREGAVGCDAEEVPNVVNRAIWTPCADGDTV